MRFHVVMFKTLEDLFNLKRTIIFLIVVLLAPIIFSIIAPRDVIFNFDTMTMATQIQMITMVYILMTFIWIAGIPLVLLISVTCGDFISKEEQDGTLLLLTSKPIRREEIVIGKYLAFLINIMILETIVILLTPLLIYFLLPIDPLVLDTMASLIPSLILYAFFVALTFGALATAFSCFSISRFKTIISLVAITVAIFFGFMIFRGYMETAGIYEPYGVWVDVNYHLGNSYMVFLDSTGYRMSPILQAILGSFTGTYDAVDPSKLYDADIGAMYTTLSRNEYISPIISLTVWLSLTFLILLFGVLKFQRREIK
ncbi:MAG: hypothetical protein DRN12_05495 [Thermoplasmata archaeon]|nr:MAG: hypothetical protein DRN12_05495 [Thermoplasmata archaeon]HEC89232.1 hypothetical protein [Thermoplasmatales archaeon]